MRFELAHPELLLLGIPLLLWGALLLPRREQGVLLPREGELRAAMRGRGGMLSLLPPVPTLLRVLGLLALLLALAGPQEIRTFTERTIEGRGVALVVDVSSSMLALDLGGGSDRLGVAREAAEHFARGRSMAGDELSLIAFAGDALTRVPPTLDPEVIALGVRTLEVQFVRDGTDISMAILTALTHLLPSEREPKVIVLLTDGAHNGTRVPPLSAARVAAARGVRVHSISLQGELPEGVRNPASQRVAEEMETALSAIATLTGGRYFHASSPALLEAIYAEIDRIERPVERVVEREEEEARRGWFLLLALTLLALEMGLRGSRWGELA